VLKVAERTGRPEIIEEMDGELKNIIEDFDRAVNVEALRLAKETRKHSPSQPCGGPFSGFCVEQELLLARLRSVDAGYDLNRRCMEGTRQFILNRIMDWTTRPQEASDAPRSNTYWVHGSPGIGKTSLAHSICEQLHDRKHLAGSFFCRRDDPNLSDLTNILPTLINALANTFSPFRRLVADHLRNDRQLTSKTMKDTLFLDFIRNLPRHPKHPLVIVIDALDECGDARSRPFLLKLLTDAVALAPWLRIIITSRPEVDIQRFFDLLTLPSHSQYDLAADQEANADLRTFARRQFGLVASDWHLPTSWPQESDFNRVISLADGLFIFIKLLFVSLSVVTTP
jgi:predicted ATPase